MRRMRFPGIAADCRRPRGHGIEVRLQSYWAGLPTQVQSRARPGTRDAEGVSSARAV